MNCQQFTKFVEAKPLSERSPQEMRRAQRHAAQCTGCAEYLQAAEKLEQTLARPPRIAPSTDFSKTVMSRVARETPARPPLTARVRPEVIDWVAVLIGALALAAGLLYRFQPHTLLDWLFSQPRGITADEIYRMIQQPDLTTWVVAAGIALAACGVWLLEARSGRARSAPER